MVLFTRTLTVLGNPRDTGGWARRMAKLVTEKTGKETALWAGLSGAAPGTHIFSAFYHNMADFATATVTLMADEQYLDGVSEGRQHLVGPPEDRHVEILHTAGGEYQRPGLGGVVQLTTATPRPGQAHRAHRMGRPDHPTGIRDHRRAGLLRAFAGRAVRRAGLDRCQRGRQRLGSHPGGVEQRPSLPRQPRRGHS
jgi:hypothetical protein